MATILLIDDDAVLRQFLLEMLEQRGHQVSCLDGADRALSILESVRVDLVLVDVKMQGMSGIDLLKAMRAKGIQIPVILMSGLATTPIKQEVEALNADVVAKPSGGNDEFWKELEPKLNQALKGGPEAEMCACLGRAFDAAHKHRQKELAHYVEEMLFRSLEVWALIQAAGNQKEAERILGVRLKELRERADATPEARHQRFVMRALTIIANHPEWTVARYAEELDCSRTKLYTDPIIGDALNRKKNSSGHKPRRGFKDADDNVDAED